MTITVSQHTPGQLRQTIQIHSHQINADLTEAAGGTDTAGIQRMVEGGSIAGAVSIPTRHLHQVIEMAHKDDIRASIDLLKACVTEINQYNWKISQ